jgi:hypothetical protein
VPRFRPGQVVQLVEDRTSVAGGKTETLLEGSIGRVCKVHVGGSYCVQLEERCLRVTEKFLRSARGNAPACGDQCTGGC